MLLAQVGAPAPFSNFGLSNFIEIISLKFKSFRTNKQLYIMKNPVKSWFILLFLLSLSCTSAMADRIKDLTTVAAMRTNQLIGYGLVVGLQGTGDGADVSFTAQSMKTLLNRLGVSLEGPLSDFETATSAGKD
jgi:hypothetical protein